MTENVKIYGEGAKESATGVIVSVSISGGKTWALDPSQCMPLIVGLLWT